MPIGLLTLSMESDVGEILGFDWQPSIVERVLLAGRATWFYAAKLIAPWPLMFVYPRWTLDDTVLWQYAFPLAAALLLFFLALACQQRRIGRAPLAAALFFGGTLLPVLGAFEIYFYRFSFVADHWQYIASLGPIALVVGGGFDRLEPRVRAILGSLLLLVLAGLTAAQARVYVDSETLWRDSLEHNPASPMVHYNLGLDLQGQSRAEDAAHHYRLAIELAPQSPNAYNNLATLRIAEGRSLEAIDLLEAALAVAPDYIKARWNLALELEKLGRFDEARPHYSRSIETAAASQDGSPASLAGSRLYYARALLRHDHPRLALRELDVLIRAVPDLVPAHVARGRALMRLGRPDEAAAAFERAAFLAPENAAAQAGLANARARARPLAPR